MKSAQSTHIGDPQASGSHSMSRTEQETPSGSFAQASMGFLVITSIPLLLLADTAVALARGWRTSSRLDYALFIAAFLWLGVAFTCLILPRWRRSLITRRVQLFAFTLSAAATCAVLEIPSALYMAQHESEHFHLRKAGLHKVFRPGSGTMPGIIGESDFTTNSIGVRGPELPPKDSAYRILCIGGSTTECLYLDDSEAWPYLLMQYLDNQPGVKSVWVGNVGISGFASDDHLRFVNESNLVGQMDMIVFLVGFNDFAMDLRQQTPHNGAQSDNLEQTNPLRPLWRRSQLLELIRVTYSARTANSILIEDEAGSAYVVRRQMRQRGRVVDYLPDLSAALERYSQEIQMLIRSCRLKGVKPVFLTQPTVYSPSLSKDTERLLWLGWTADGSYLSVPRLRAGLDQYNAALMVACSELGARCIDLTSMSGHEEFFYDDAHFTEAGSNEVAHLVAEAIGEELFRQ